MYKESTGRLARWRLRLLEYDFDIQCRKGVKHQAADALSRLETEGHEIRKIYDDLPGELPIGVIADEAVALDLNDKFDDNKPYLDTALIANVTTRSQRMPRDNICEQESTRGIRLRASTAERAGHRTCASA